jgi:hypothetical protein
MGWSNTIYQCRHANIISEEEDELEDQGKDGQHRIVVGAGLNLIHN